jgi:hypothetical protein
MYHNTRYIVLIVLKSIELGSYTGVSCSIIVCSWRCSATIHRWLGDAQVTAEEAMYNLWTPGVYELFANEMRNSQEANSSSPFLGFVKGVARVPSQCSPTPRVLHLNFTAFFCLRPSRKRYN